MLSDLSVKRPVFASVLGLLLIVFGTISFFQLPLREYPDIDPPVVSITTVYPGAAASVVESRITELIEDRISGIEGIATIESRSTDGISTITVEFNTGRDIDAATNDVRDRVSGILNNLPTEADIPDIRKVDSSDDVIMWLNLIGEGMTVPEITDYAERFLVDRFSVLDGVARVLIGGAQRFAMRVWIDRTELAARGLTVTDLEEALRRENVELPAGSIESLDRQFTVRLGRAFRDADDFRNLVVGRGADGYLIRLGDVARVELGKEETRTFFRGNLVPQVGLGIIKQSTANTIEVARAAKLERDRINQILPPHLSIEQSYDTSVFIEASIAEVYKTLLIAITLVVIVIYLFIGSFRAMLIPAVTVPISIIGTFTILAAFGFSINILTLLGLVLAIGLVVDDAIVVLENISRRLVESGESPLVAAFLGSREVIFAVISTTVVLVSVFVPLAFIDGDIGRLFSEFALTMAAAVILSSFVALSVSPMLASKILRSDEKPSLMARLVRSLLQRISLFYSRSLKFALRLPVLVFTVFAAILIGSGLLFRQLPQEFAPAEDRGAFFILVNGPEGATFAYIEEYMDEIESRMMRFVDQGEIERLLVRAPRAFGATESFNSGILICVLNDWSQRRGIWEMIGEVRGMLSDLPGVRAFPVVRQGFGGGISKPVQFVIGGSEFDDLIEWRDILLAELAADNPGIVGVDWDYKETKPQIDVVIDYDRAAALGVRIETIGRTLETLLGSRRVTTFVREGEEYDVILEGERDSQQTPASLDHIYVRSETSSQLIPLANLVTFSELADTNSLNRFNRVRSITIEGNLADGFSLGDALAHLRDLARQHLPEEVVIDYKGQSRDLEESGSSFGFVFLVGLSLVYLVLAAQFESYRSPLVIMFTVPLAIFGGLLGITIAGGTLNIYSQIGLIMLVGLASKNGILIVEFANQLRDRGTAFEQAILESCRIRFRPILMTAITTGAGSIPLLLTSGAGAETRIVIGTVILSGIVTATLCTLYIIPVAYKILAKNSGSPLAVTNQLAEELNRAGKNPSLPPSATNSPTASTT
ncbi:MAG: efflux RND transporter permease subunit [Puniceicoccaceae bacterium]